MDNLTKIPKYQWSKFSPDRSEQFVVRTDDLNELWKTRDEVINRFPAVDSFPDDIGHSKATTPEKVQQEAPKCGVHGTPMSLRQGQYGNFWSCGTKNADGTWCKYKPAKNN